jgi:4-hydroxybenzoate polyprenyltransferase
MKLLDLVFAARPMLHLPIWSIYLVALFYNRKLTSGHFQWLDVGMLTGLSLLASGAYYLNQVYDYDSDKINRKLGFLQFGLLNKKELMAAYLVVSVMAIGYSFFFSFLMLVIFLQLFLFGYVYSTPPLRFKDRPFPGLLANAYTFGFLVPLTVMPQLNLHDANRLDWDNPIYFFLAVAAIYLLTTLPDRKGDKAVGKRTMAVLLKPTTVKLIAFLLMILAAGVAIRSQRNILVFLSLVSSLPTMITLFLKSDKLELFAAKFPILLLTLLAGYFYPGYLVFIVVVLISCRIYYRRRLNLVYPNLM